MARQPHRPITASRVSQRLQMTFVHCGFTITQFTTTTNPGPFAGTTILHHHNFSVAVLRNFFEGWRRPKPRLQKNFGHVVVRGRGSCVQLITGQVQELNTPTDPVSQTPALSRSSRHQAGSLLYSTSSSSPLLSSHYINRYISVSPSSFSTHRLRLGPTHGFIDVSQIMKLLYY